MRRLVSFKDETSKGERLWRVVKRGQKYTVMVSQNGTNAMIAGCGWYNTKAEACERLEEYADILENKS